MAFKIKKGDTSPSLLAILQDGDGVAVDVTDASIRFHMTPLGSSTVKVDATAVIVDGATGSVRYEWASGDTDTEGAFNAEFEVTFANSAIETFPNDGYFRVDVDNDLA